MEQEDAARLVSEFQSDVFTERSVKLFLDEIAKRILGLKPMRLEDAQEIALRTMEEVYESVHNFKGKGAFWTWATRIALNEACDFWREKYGVKLEITGLHAEDSGFDVENVAHQERFEDHEQLRRDADETLLLEWACQAALDSLEENDRRLVSMHVYEGYEFTELAPLFEATANTLQKRFERAIPKLRQHLQIDGWFQQLPLKSKG